jgi:hypothetical protein
MMKSVVPTMAPPSRTLPAIPVDFKHYVDPHVWWQGGETIEFETPAKQAEAAVPNRQRYKITQCR